LVVINNTVKGAKLVVKINTCEEQVVMITWKKTYVHFYKHAPVLFYIYIACLVHHHINLVIYRVIEKDGRDFKQL
jgi:hypothetical protein